MMHSDWKNRLEQWAPEPPAAVWGRLSEQLAAEDQPAFAKRLKHFSAAPPPGAWQAITDRMEPVTSKPLIQLFPRNKFVRYGSVAASFLLAFLLFRQSGPETTKEINPPATVQQHSGLPLPGASTHLPTDRVRTPVAKKKVNATARMAATVPRIPTPHISKDPLPTAQAEKSYSERFYEVIPAAAPQMNDSYVERYIITAVTEDAAVRLPKKLYALFRCNDVPDAPGCLERLDNLRRQSAAPSLLTPADFSGLLELVRQVE